MNNRHQLKKQLDLRERPNQGLSQRRSGRWNAGMICVILLMIGVVILVSQFGSRVSPDGIEEWVKGSGLSREGWGAPIAFFFVGLIVVSLFLPKTVVSLSAGALFGTSTGCLLIALISIVAAIGNYAIGRWWLSESLARRLTSTENHTPPLWQVAVRDLAAEASYGFHLLLRFASIPSMMLNFFMGAVKARFTPFMVAVVVGILPQWLWVHGGALASLGGQESSVGSWGSSVVSLIAAALIAVLVPRRVMRRIKTIQQEDQKAP